MSRMGIDIDEAKVERNELGLWLGWTLATGLGMLLGFLPSILLVNLLDLQWARIIIPLLAGFLIGLTQWAVLRNYLVESYDWVLAGGTSWAVGYALGLFLINSLSSTALGALIGFILFGVIIALVQWPLLRREIPSLWMWILANVVGNLLMEPGLLAERVISPDPFQFSVGVQTVHLGSDRMPDAPSHHRSRLAAVYGAIGGDFHPDILEPAGRDQ